MKWPGVIISGVLAVLVGAVIPPPSSASRYGAALCESSVYACYRVKKGDTWEKVWRDPAQRDLVRRINRINIPMQPGMRLAVPRRFADADPMQFAPFVREIEPSGSKLLVFDPQYLAWGAYSPEGRLIHWGPAVGGMNWCDDVQHGCRTRAGDFKIYHKRGAQCVSSKFPLDPGLPRAPMPYCMFFNGGFAFHGSPNVPGQHASHGCVRLFTEDARWLNEEFVDTQGGTRVRVLPYRSSAPPIPPS